MLPALLLLPFAAARAEMSRDDLWEELRAGRAVAMIRHALAPGTGDPPALRIGDCASQRNLSDRGRADAGRLGDLFRANGIASAEVLSSRWCRSAETARLLGLGPVRETEMLDSLFGRSAEAPARNAALLAHLERTLPGAVQVLVTHQANINAFVDGPFAREGEIFVVRPAARASERLLGRIPPP
ncbi:MAG: histidine phosphatase family protein [Alphaproteobacteria bacterium]|nr:histidine phosphatase family protein [Alphaproteobacteria bacterium]